MRPRIIDRLLGSYFRVENFNSWLDIGTGNGNTACSHPYYNKIPNKTGIDTKIPLKSFHGSEWEIIKEEYKEGCSVWDREFQLVTMFDIIEHYSKEDGIKILNHLEKTTKLIIVFTPNGYYKIEGPQWDKWDLHKCGWETEEFLNKGYTVKLLKDFHEDGDALLAWKYKL